MNPHRGKNKPSGYWCCKPMEEYRMRKANEVMKELRDKGFRKNTEEFFKKSLYLVLDEYNIKDELSVIEYYKLLRLMIDECALNDLEDLGIGVCNTEELGYK